MARPGGGDDEIEREPGEIRHEQEEISHEQERCSVSPWSDSS
jgi:hypothetical protein